MDEYRLFQGYFFLLFEHGVSGELFERHMPIYTTVGRLSYEIGLYVSFPINMDSDKPNSKTKKKEEEQHQGEIMNSEKKKEGEQHEEIIDNEEL